MTYAMLITSILFACSAVVIAVLMANQVVMLVVCLMSQMVLHNRSDFKRINTEILWLSQLKTLKLLENYLLVVFREINTIILSPIEDQA